MRVPEGQALEALVRALADWHGVACPEEEFPQLVQAFRALMGAVGALDDLPIPPEVEPAAAYRPVPPEARP